jgi:hypothetical protein
MPMLARPPSPSVGYALSGSCGVTIIASISEEARYENQECVNLRDVGHDLGAGFEPRSRCARCALTADQAIRTGANDLGVVVSTANGPEAGVWVINGRALSEQRYLLAEGLKLVVGHAARRYELLVAANQPVAAGEQSDTDSRQAEGSPTRRWSLRARGHGFMLGSDMDWVNDPSA